jgi:hypothetical protein
MLTIPETLSALVLRAMFTAIKFALVLQAMANNAAAAVFTHWRQGMNRAFEAVVGVGFASYRHLKCLIVVIPARFALSHVHAPDSPFGRQLACDRIGSLPAAEIG